MESRAFGLIDRFIGEIDKAIKTLSAPARSVRDIPEAGGGMSALADPDRLESGRLMRVNHSGEIAAQALYQGQALTARDPAVAGAMRRAAAEEGDHLAWCEQRLRELNGRSSLLNPLWYAGSYAIGALAGALGDRASLGFIAETERQVESHLRDHLTRLPAADSRSRAILERMTHDEIEHGAQAASLGAKALPIPLVRAMRWSSRVMTGGSYWL
jgi:ubiquinone biosynthesis monooxygenase Coq7